MQDEIIVSIFKKQLKRFEDVLDKSEARENTHLRNLVHVGNDCDTAIAKLTVMQTSLKEWTDELSKKKMTAIRKEILTEQLTKMELTLDGFDHFEYDLQKLHRESIAKWKANASFQSSCQGHIRYIIVRIDKSEATFARGNDQIVKQLNKLRSRFNQMIWVSKKIAERFHRLEGSPTYSDKRLLEFNDQLDKVCREFNAVRSRLITRIH